MRLNGNDYTDILAEIRILIKRRMRRNSLRRLIFIRLHACSVSYTHTYAHDRCVRTREISAIAETNENEFRKNRKIKTSIQCSTRSTTRREYGQNSLSSSYGGFCTRFTWRRFRFEFMVLGGGNALHGGG